MPTYLLHRNLFFGISLSRELTRDQCLTEADEWEEKHTHLLQEGIRKGLNAELEGTIVGGLVQPLHFLCHECLMYRFTFPIRRIHCSGQ